MSTLFDAIGRRALFAFEAETAHGLSLAALRARRPFCPPRNPDPRLAVTVAGLSFPNPLGMAAGFDKNGEVPDALLALGFGFAEAGTITPRAQAGNPRPRVFRLPEDRAVINRLGFNNEGHERCLERLSRRRVGTGILGVNVGANRDSTDRIEDFRLGVERFAAHSSYIAVNISSPNTPGLRDLQGRAMLAGLLSAVAAERALRDKVLAKRTPLFLKIAPDLGEADLDDIAAEVLDKGIDGVIVSNTTIRRDGLAGAAAAEQGGVSGRPLFRRSTAALARMRARLGRRPALIGLGGVDSAETAFEKIAAGADLVQLYTGMIYGGPGLVARITRGLSAIAATRGAANILDLRDSRLDHWLREPL